MNIKQLLELGDKRTQGEWVYSVEGGCYPTLRSEKETLSMSIPHDSVGLGFEDAEYCAAAPDMEAKLREIVEMLPEIKNALAGYASMQEWVDVTDVNLNPDECERLHDKLDKWENS